MNLKNFEKRGRWVCIWSGKWSLHSCSQFGQQWTIDSKVLGEPVYPYVVYINKRGINDCWVPVSDKDNLGKRLISMIEDDSNNARIIADSLKKNADILVSFCKKHKGKEITLEDYKKFWAIVAAYYIPHISVKYIVDYLSPEDLKKYLPIFEDARLYSEQSMRYQENLMEQIAEQIANKSGLTKELVLCTGKDELIKYFQGKKLPKKLELEERDAQAVQFCCPEGAEIFSGKKARKAEEIILPKDAGEIKGQTAYGGKASGKVRIVLNAFKYQGLFEVGDILVSGMTRPEFMPLMEKAGAIVTDAGGILSHAAITAREMKKPCVIGTQTATKMLTDGDLVEVDADNGIVKIIINK